MMLAIGLSVLTVGGLLATGHECVAAIVGVGLLWLLAGRGSKPAKRDGEEP